MRNEHHNAKNPYYIAQLVTNLHMILRLQT